MRPGPTGVLLGERPVRWLGIGLIVFGLLLPWLILAWRAADPPPTQATDGPITLRPELVALPAGSFQMGSPPGEEGRDEDERLHEVRIPSPFMISRTEVTRGQLRAVMGAGALHRSEDSFGDRCEKAGVGADLPAVCVTWHEAVAFCNRLSELEGLKPTYVISGEGATWPDRNADGYRLPTEEEWEYAARAGTGDTWVGTDKVEDVCRYGNVVDRSAKAENPEWSTFDCDDGFPRLSPAADGKIRVNAWHLHGLGGNAAEWVWDWYGPYSEGDGSVDDDGRPGAGSDRVIRGGSWRFDPRFARAANRIWLAPGYRDDNVGFRLARSCPSAVLPSDCLK